MDPHDHPTRPPEITPEVLEEAMRRARRLRSQVMWDIAAFLAGALRQGAQWLAGAARPPARRSAR